MENEAVKNFALSENDAVTVDWVVLTAALVGLGLATGAIASGGPENLLNGTVTSLASIQAGTSFGADASGGWKAGALLNWSQELFDQHIDRWREQPDADMNVGGAIEALNRAEAGSKNPAHQLDAAAAHITAATQLGLDTTELQTRYDAAHAEYVANNT